LKIIRIFYGDIRTEITDNFVPPFVIEMIGVFHELLTVDSELPPFYCEQIYTRTGGKSQIVVVPQQTV
jgi:hypothetical protein